MSGGNVLGNLFVPTKETSLRAVSLSMLAVRAMPEVTPSILREKLDCCDETIYNASNEVNLIRFDKIARLAHFFPDQCAPIHSLWGRERAELTAEDHRAAIEHHTAELVRMTQVRA
jgi:hypothetical protein